MLWIEGRIIPVNESKKSTALDIDINDYYNSLNIMFDTRIKL